MAGLSGNFDLEDQECSRRPGVIDDDQTENEKLVCILVKLYCVSGGIVRPCFIWTPCTKPDVEFKQILFPTGLIKGSNQWKMSEIGQLEECCLTSEKSPDLTKN